MMSTVSTQSTAPGKVDSPSAATAEETSELIKESLQIAGSYDPKDRFDPFEPLFKEQPTVQETTTEKGKREKRKPQTPLERVALSQLKVTAIIRSPGGNRALVQDASGKGYVVRKGTYIGLNAGQVIEIDKDRIVVEALGALQSLPESTTASIIYAYSSPVYDKNIHFERRIY